MWPEGHEGLHLVSSSKYIEFNVDIVARGKQGRSERGVGHTSDATLCLKTYKRRPKNKPTDSQPIGLNP